MKFITTPNRLIKREIALRWRTDALNAGGGSETDNSSVIRQLQMLNCVCVCSCNNTYWNVWHSRGRQLAYQRPTVLLPDRIPMGKAGISESWRIRPPASCEAQQRLAAPLPASLQEQLPNSCCELCNSDVYNEGAPPVGAQTRTYNLCRVRKEAAWQSVPAVVQLEIYNRQLRVTCSWLTLHAGGCQWERRSSHVEAILATQTACWGLGTHKTAVELQESVLCLHC